MCEWVTEPYQNSATGTKKSQTRNRFVSGLCLAVEVDVKRLESRFRRRNGVTLLLPL
jgi:hypothetical protein